MKVYTFYWKFDGLNHQFSIKAENIEKAISTLNIICPNWFPKVHSIRIK